MGFTEVWRTGTGALSVVWVAIAVVGGVEEEGEDEGRREGAKLWRATREGG